jgi:predicted N-acetyltransferase YhbS
MSETLSPSLPRTTAMAPERPEDEAAVEALITAAFGAGRFAKTAERLREGSKPSGAFAVHDEGQVVGSVRLWPVRVGETPALFLGPIAVDAGHRSAGLGAELVAACVNHARMTATGGILLVGDRAYFERFGFVPAPDAVLPGPVDRRRVLWLPVQTQAVAGLVRIDA